jgi:Flp pilus assembly protein TadD
MAMDLAKFRKLVSLDDQDPLSRFALGQALFQQEHTSEALSEAAEHLTFANTKAPDHLATYNILSQVLIKLGRKDDARTVLQAGIDKSSGVVEGMGRDLAPAMMKLLETL